MKNSLAIKNILMQAGLFKLVRLFRMNKGVAILRYHSIVNDKDNFYASPSICTPPDIFEDQVCYLSRNFNIVTLDIVADCLLNKKPFPDKALVFTFDDGYRDNYLAYNILKKYGVSGTFYIAADCIENKSRLWLFEVIYLVSNTRKKKITIQVNNRILDFELDMSKKWQVIRHITALIKSNDLISRELIRSQLIQNCDDVTDLDEKSQKVMLTWDQVREMADNLMTIGGHTMTHLNLPNAKPADAFSEIKSCKKLIEEKINRPVNHFSYPNGGPYDYYNDEIVEMVKKSGYQTSTTSNNGMETLTGKILELKRLRVTNHLSEILYQIDVESLINKRDINV